MANKAAENLDPGTEAVKDPWWPDFRVKSVESSVWQIAVISRKGFEWARSKASFELSSGRSEVTTTDLTSLNHLISNARDNGLRVEYVGPFQVFRL
ncbi:hypothetical protein [Roseibium litorale]|uniref:Uncharacterized protein n=1 Tax=Roseibium litorale TaxID=2803841 RepID=A0ABR9CQX3_9HYPH|nr:hypothetical protein [Roseibium litorale]MBD8892677.1 hypothetical protein [Roseibium litorale]